MVLLQIFWFGGSYETKIFTDQLGCQDETQTGKQFVLCRVHGEGQGSYVPEAGAC